VAKYRKKPVVIEAFQFKVTEFDDVPDWFLYGIGDREITIFDDRCEIKTLEGVMSGNVGDWIIQGVNGVHKLTLKEVQ
jgi:hypothetical protein